MICVDWDGVMKVYPTNAMDLLSMEEEDGVVVLRKKCDPVVSCRHREIIAETTFSNRQKRKGGEIMNCVECKTEKFTECVLSV